MMIGGSDRGWKKEKTKLNLVGTYENFRTNDTG